MINVESSHCYPDQRGQIAQWERQLAESPLTMLADADINREVVRGLDKIWNLPEATERLTRQVRPRMRSAAFAAIPVLHRALQTRDMCYRLYSFAKD